MRKSTQKKLNKRRKSYKNLEYISKLLNAYSILIIAINVSLTCSAEIENREFVLDIINLILLVIFCFSVMIIGIDTRTSKSKEINEDTYRKIVLKDVRESSKNPIYTGIVLVIMIILSILRVIKFERVFLQINLLAFVIALFAKKKFKNEEYKLYSKKIKSNKVKGLA